MKNFKSIFSTKRTVLLWAVAIAVAVGGGTAAMAAAGSNSDSVLTQQDVSNQLADDSSSAPAPSESSSQPDPRNPAPDNRAVTLPTMVGWVAASCQGGNAYLHSWSPKPGYRADHAMRGPARTVSVEFESDTSNDVRVYVSCGANDEPFVKIQVKVDDHGGDRHRGGDDRHRGGDDRHRGGDDDNSGPGSGGDDNSGRDHPEDD